MYRNYNCNVFVTAIVNRGELHIVMLSTNVSVTTIANTGEFHIS